MLAASGHPLLAGMRLLGHPPPQYTLAALALGACTPIDRGGGISCLRCVVGGAKYSTLLLVLGVSAETYSCHAAKSHSVMQLASCPRLLQWSAHAGPLRRNQPSLAAGPKYDDTATSCPQIAMTGPIVGRGIGCHIMIVVKLKRHQTHRNRAKAKAPLSFYPLRPRSVIDLLRAGSCSSSSSQFKDEFSSALKLCPTRL